MAALTLTAGTELSEHTEGAKKRFHFTKLNGDRVTPYTRVPIRGRQPRGQALRQQGRSASSPRCSGVPTTSILQDAGQSSLSRIHPVPNVPSGPACPR